MRTLKFLVFILCIAFTQRVDSQTAIISLPSSVSALPMTQLSVPITVLNFDSVCSISLAFSYDTTVLQFIGWSYIELPNGAYDFYRDKNQFRLGWYTLVPTNLADNDTLFSVYFLYLGGNTSLNWDLSQGNCMIGSCITGVKPTSFVNGSVIPQPMGEIGGRLTYDNSSQSPMAQVSVILKNSQDVVIDNQLSDNQGNYSFQVTETGNYSIVLEPPQAWSGINSIDALKIVRYFVGTDILDNLALQAADVNDNNFVNTSDALLVLKRYVGLITTFPAGNWTFEMPIINMVSLTHLTINIKALCMGDVDHSYVP